MTLLITGKNLDVGEALRSYVTERIEHTLEKYVGSGLSGHVRIEKERSTFRTDCSIQLRSGLALQSHEKVPNAYSSADLALERLEKRLRRYRRRLKKHHGPSPEPATAVAYYVIEDDGEEAADDDNPVIIAKTETMIHELAVSDAVMQMDLSQKAFLIFRSADHGGLNVVYRRPDGNIGRVDPGEKPRQFQSDEY